GLARPDGRAGAPRSLSIHPRLRAARCAIGPDQSRQGTRQQGAEAFAEELSGALAADVSRDHGFSQRPKMAWRHRRGLSAAPQERETEGEDPRTSGIGFGQTRALIVSAG